MEHLPFITNDTERSYVVQKESGRHTELCILTPDGSDQAHLCIADYVDGSDEPISEVKLYSEEARCARKLLNDPESLKILGIED